MKPAAILAIGAESPLGSGRDAYAVGAAGARPASAIAEDPALRGAGMKKPFLARACHVHPPGEDRAASLLGAAARALVQGLEPLVPGFRALRVAVAVGTSSGGMLPLTDAFARLARAEAVPPALARAAPYFGPLASLDAALGVAPVARVQVLAACASSAVALGLGTRWLELGVADLVIAGGYDAVSVFVAAGFECIGATSASLPNPFREVRDGMALGEAAVLYALARPGLAPALGHLRGFAASSDAVHVTAPDRTGDGLARAARGALADAGIEPGAVGLVSAHATATPFNDSAEAKALELALGLPPNPPVIHPFKAVVGHTLGASAALELAAALGAMARSVLPAAIGSGATVPGLPGRLLETNESGDAGACLKLSAAFAGCNAAIVASSETSIQVVDSRAAGPRPSVVLKARGAPRRAADLGSLAIPTRIPPTHLARLDPLSAACVAAAASVLESRPELPSLDRVGVIVGSAASVIENDDAFDLRVREQGARAAEPRRFPATSPNVPAGQCAIAFGLRGPAFAVGAGPEAPFEALLVAWDLLAVGDADALLVIAAEDVGPAVTSLWAAAGYPVPAGGAVAALLCRGEGPALDRERVWGLWSRARAGLGRLDATAPGWPAFGAGLELLAAGPT